MDPLHEEWKVSIEKASITVFTFTAGFRPGSRFTYFVYMAFCTVQQWNEREFPPHFAKLWVMRVVMKRSAARTPEPKKSWLRSFFSVACFAHFSFCFSRWILDFFNLRSDFSRWTESSSSPQDLPRGSVLHFTGRRHDRINTRFKWGAKIVIFLFPRELPILKRIYGVFRFLGFSWKLARMFVKYQPTNCVRLWGNPKYFSCNVPERVNNRNIPNCLTTEYIFSGTNRNIEKG